MSKEIRNSLYCVDSQGRLGMVGEMNPVVTFFLVKPDGTLEVPAVTVDPGSLRIARAEELPAGHGLTPQQLVDIGYSDPAPAPGGEASRVLAESSSDPHA